MLDFRIYPVHTVETKPALSVRGEGEGAAEKQAHICFAAQPSDR